MSALSIRNMHFTQIEQERRQWAADAAEYARQAVKEQSHYWFIERKSKRGNTWIFVRDFIGTKKEVAELWRKYFHNREPQHRLIHKLSYRG